MRLYFLRHGEAGHNFSSDFERELTEVGVRQSKKIGKFCDKTGIYFTHIFASPLIRAQQTAQIVMSKLSPIEIHTIEHLTPESDPRNLLEHLRTFPPESRILLVTHEPFVSTCISTLISGTETANVMMKTTSFACIEINGLPVKGSGRIRWLLTPGLIDKLV